METRSASCRRSSLTSWRDGLDGRLAAGLGAVDAGAVGVDAVGVSRLADPTLEVDPPSEPPPSDAIARTINTRAPPISPAIRPGSQLRQPMNRAPDSRRRGGSSSASGALVPVRCPLSGPRFGAAAGLPAPAAALRGFLFVDRSDDARETGSSIGSPSSDAAGYSIAFPHPPQTTRTIGPAEPCLRWTSNPPPHSSW
jgi:hypothetical protein